MASDPYPDLRRGVWVMKYRPDPTGKWVKVTLGADPRLRSARPPKSPPQWVEDRARGFAEIEYRARHGLEAAPARMKSLESYLRAYADGYGASHDAGSTKQLRRHVARFLAFAEQRGVSSLQGVKRGVCRDYLEARIAVVGHNTLRTEMRYLSPIWSRAVEDELVASNPWSRLPVPGKPTEREPTFWTGDQVRAIAEHCGKPWQRDLVLVLANTGMRISTALAMEWSWIDWGRGVIAIPATEGEDDIKTSYRLVLNHVARDVLTRRHLEGDGRGEDLVFPNPYRGGGLIPYDTARDAIAKAITRARVPPGVPHDLRHTYALALMESGVPANVVQAQLGHTTLAMTQRYIRTKVEHARERLEDFGLGGGSGDVA